ncbi:MAG: DUF4388 domain-containing protein [Actinomycetes bacterium]
MKLEGSLDAFSLPDVFQLLSLTKKSGGLHLTNGEATGMVYFAGGSITGAISDIERQALARRLVGLGAADDSALRRAVERATTDGSGVARALVEAGAVDAALVQRLALEQAVDAVFDLLRWPNGDFSFGMGDENPDDVGLSVTAEQIVGDATSRREAWDALSRLIPSPDVVLTMPVVLPEETSVDAEAWALLALIDGVRSVGQIVDVSGSGQYSVVSTLAALIQRGLLVLRDEETLDHVALVRRRQLLLAPLEGTPAPEDAPAAPPAPIDTLPDSGAGGSTGLPPAGAVAQDSTIAATGGGHQIPHAPQGQPAAAPAAAAASVAPGLLPGAHDPNGVVPPRPEPFLPKRDVEHPEPVRAPGFASPAGAGVGMQSSVAPSTVGGLSAGSTAGAATGTAGAATATAPAPEGAIERDPTVNRSLMLRLIAGVRGL